MSFETYTNDCSKCEVRGTSIKLSFNKDKSFRNLKTKQSWQKELVDFFDLLNIEEDRITALNAP